MVVEPKESRWIVFGAVSAIDRDGKSSAFFRLVGLVDPAETMFGFPPQEEVDGSTWSVLCSCTGVCVLDEFTGGYALFGCCIEAGAVVAHGFETLRGALESSSRSGTSRCPTGLFII